jgi:ribosomal protein S18 acetylase RimI-like enzyme
MTSDSYSISPACLDEIPSLLRMISDSEGWSLCFEAPIAWLAVDPNCFFVGRLNGHPVSTICSIRYEESYGFLGCYWVSKDHRGKGLGLTIFKQAISHLDGCNIGLSAVLKQVQNYEKSGFVRFSSDWIFRGLAVHLTVPNDQNIIEYDDSLFDSIVAYDRQVFPSKRSPWLKEWLKLPKSISRVYIENGEVRGYAQLHEGAFSPEIGPCYADSKEIAKELIMNLVNQVVEGKVIRIYLQEENPQAIEFVRELSQYQFEKEATMKRMYTKGPPKIEVGKVWCPSSVDIG